MYWSTFSSAGAAALSLERWIRAKGKGGVPARGNRSAYTRGAPGFESDEGGWEMDFFSNGGLREEDAGKFPGYMVL